MIQPASPVFVHVGGQVQFRLQSPFKGEWKSENEGILTIDATGKATALSRGTVYVTFANFRNKVVIFEGSLLAKSEVTVLDNYLQKAPHSLPIKVFVATQDFQ